MVDEHKSLIFFYMYLMYFDIHMLYMQQDAYICI